MLKSSRILVHPSTMALPSCENLGLVNQMDPTRSLALLLQPLTPEILKLSSISSSHLSLRIYLKMAASVL